MFSLLPTAWVAISLEENSPAFLFWLTIHKNLGLAIFCITFARLIWRFVDRPPVLPKSLSKLNKHGAHFVSGLLLILMLVMPISGYLATTAHGHDVMLLGMVQMPRFAWNDTEVGDFFFATHVVAQYLVYAAIGLHIIGVAYHSIFKQDGILGRMLPEHATEPKRDAEGTATRFQSDVV
jgi:cytochrome b561